LFSSQIVNLYQRRFEYKSVTGNLLENSSAVRIEFFKGVNFHFTRFCWYFYSTGYMSRCLYIVFYTDKYLHLLHLVIEYNLLNSIFLHLHNQIVEYKMLNYLLLFFCCLVYDYCHSMLNNYVYYLLFLNFFD